MENLLYRVSVGNTWHGSFQMLDSLGQALETCFLISDSTAAMAVCAFVQILESALSFGDAKF